jgi:nicotinate-nucleotide adenylyltransferase
MTTPQRLTTIGLLGGTFNPIHFGHLRIAETLSEALRLDEVRFIPAANPPHKVMPLVSAKARAKMVEIAIRDNPLFQLDTQELNRPGHSYTVDTLLSLRAALGNEVSLVLLMGSDAFSNLHTWHRYTDILQLCNIALVQRLPTEEQALPLAKELDDLMRVHFSDNVSDVSIKPHGVITVQAMAPLAITSTDLRERLRQKMSARYLMPDAVIAYVLEQQLYK